MIILFFLMTNLDLENFILQLTSCLLLTDMLDKGKSVDLIFFDFAKVFDTVCHRHGRPQDFRQGGAN